MGERLEEIAGFRNRLTHHYEDVTARELFEVIASDLGDLETIAGALRRAASRAAGEGD